MESVCARYDAQSLYRLAASAEQLSEHPLGKAIVRCCRKTGAVLAAAAAFEMLPGRGVRAKVEGQSILAGNPELLRENGVEPGPVPPAEALLRHGCTVIYVAVDGVFAGYIALSDALRKESAATIAALSGLGVRPVLLTDDHENAARTIAAQLHIHEVRANCLPEDKLNDIGAYQAEGLPVCMIGDGVNDAADIALVDDEVRELPHLVALSKRMMTTLKLNMTFSMTLNFIAIILAMTGALSPVVGALVHNAGSVLVITNSAFLLNFVQKRQAFFEKNAPRLRA